MLLSKISVNNEIIKQIRKIKYRIRSFYLEKVRLLMTFFLMNYVLNIAMAPVNQQGKKK